MNWQREFDEEPDPAGSTPRGSAAELAQRHALAAHEQLDAHAFPDAPEIPGLRRLIRESWQRSAKLQANPDIPEAPLAMDRDVLEEYRRQHPLATIMPVIHKLLIQPSHDSGLLVAVGDEVGRLLWVEGDPVMQRRAEGMMFVPGADWSEARWEPAHREPRSPWAAASRSPAPSTTNAPSTRGAARPFRSRTRIRVRCWASWTSPARSRRWRPTRCPWWRPPWPRRRRSCASSGSSWRRPRRGRRHDGGAPVPLPSPGSAPEGSLYRNSLQLLGRDQALLSIEGRTVALSARHSEILALLSTHPDGLSAEELSTLLYPGDGSSITLRAEMVRLRKVLQQLSPAAVPESRPYKLAMDLVPDSGQVLSCLQRGAHRIALEIYRGAVLPRSEAPGVAELRDRVSALLREAVLTDGSAETLLKYAELPEARDDVGVRLAALKLLPPRSPKRAAVVADLERLETELSA